jgi:tetratricopeptide (TPR) repeat protein
MTDPISTRYKEALRRGHVAVVKGRPREAVQHYEEAGRLAEQRPLPFVSMGSVYLQMRQPREALRAFDEALRRAPSDLEAMRGKAQALEADGKATEAAALRSRAAELEAMERASHRTAPEVDPRSVELERHIVAASAARASGDLDSACAAYLLVANGYLAANDFDAALDACLRALEAHPGNIDVHFTMAVMYLRLGWVAHGVQRVTLIERRLDVDDDPRRRAALHALARDHRALAPELEQLAAKRH